MWNSYLFLKFFVGVQRYRYTILGRKEPFIKEFLAGLWYLSVVESSLELRCYTQKISKYDPFQVHILFERSRLIKFIDKPALDVPTVIGSLGGKITTSTGKFIQYFFSAKTDSFDRLIFCRYFESLDRNIVCDYFWNCGFDILSTQIQRLHIT